MKILSLFDGMACGALAMQVAGIEIDKYIAYEVDKYAIQTAQHNFPFIEERGDVFKADFTEFAGFDYLIGGSPCTYWSIAQTKSRETVASGMGWELFSQYVRALHEAKPRYFLYENNKSMSAAIRASITETFGFEPILINSALVSAQNRQRLYWCGIRQADGTYKKADIQQPADRGILLKDILETNGTTPINAMKYELASVENKDAGVVGVLDMAGHDQNKRVYGTNGKCATLTTCQGGNLEPKVFEKIAEPLNAGEVKYCNDKNIAHICRPFGSKAKVITENEKAPTLMAAMGTGGGNGVYYAENMKVREITNAPIYEVKDGFITVKGNKYPIKLVDGFYIIRKLTVRECMRLQTVPEWYEWPVSKSQAYKMLGNGWTVEVIAHLLRGCTPRNQQE
jgi:DNA-cytosine methyltransferase